MATKDRSTASDRKTHLGRGAHSDDAHGPGGAKGIGELPMDGVAPAIANAIERAVGARVTRIPVTPEVLMELLQDQKHTMEGMEKERPAHGGH